MTDYLTAAKRGDRDTAFGYFAEDIALHIPGRSAFAGDPRGKEAVEADQYVVDELLHHVRPR